MSDRRQTTQQPSQRRQVALSWRMVLAVAGPLLLLVALLLVVAGSWYLVVSQRAERSSPDVRPGWAAPLPSPPLWTVGVTGLALAGVVLLLVRVSLSRVLVPPSARLIDGAARIGAGELSHRISAGERDALLRVTDAFNEMASQVSEHVRALQTEVVGYTEALARRNAQLRAVAIIGQEAARQPNVNALLNVAVSAVTDNFDFYHTGIFILDDSRAWAILRAASSEGGRRMLGRGHRLAVGQVGIVGYVASAGRPRIASNVGEDSVWFNNPDLPETRAEMALPLAVNGSVIGVLDVQSRTAQAFSDEDIDTLQLVADQITVALSNARTLASLETAVRDLRQLQVDYAESGWARVAKRVRPLAYEYDQVDTNPVAPLPVPDDLARGKVPYKVIDDGGTPVVVESLRIGDQILGYLGLTDPSRTWTKEELELVQSVGEQVALALDNARLFEDTQRNQRQQYLISRVLQVASDPDLGAGDVLDRVAAILAQGLGLAVGVFTFPFADRPVIRTHAVVDEQGRDLSTLDADRTLAPEYSLFFQGLTAAELGPIWPLLDGVELSEEGQPARPTRSPSQPHERLSGYDLDRVLYVPIAAASTGTSVDSDSLRVRGFLGLLQPHASPPIDPDTRELAENLASQIAVVLENLSLTEETQRRSQELRQLYRISLALTGQLAPAEVLSTILVEGRMLLGAEGAKLWVYNRDSGRLILTQELAGAGSELLVEDRGSGTVDAVASLAAESLRQRKTLWVADYATWDGRNDNLAADQLPAVMAVPLMGRTGPLGVLVVLADRVGAFGERDAGLADLFSAQAAAALESAQLNQDAQRRAMEFSQLYEAGIDLVTILDLGDLLDRAADWSLRVFDADRALVCVNEPMSGRLATGLSVSRDLYRIADGEGAAPDAAADALAASAAVLSEEIVAGGQSVLIPDGRESATSTARMLAESGLLSQIGTPLRIGADVLGALLVSGAEPGQFGLRDVTMLEFLAAQIASALQNALQFGQTERALTVVGQQARYQRNVSQAVALLNERGTTATESFLGLLGEAADGAIAVYYETLPGTDVDPAASGGAIAASDPGANGRTGPTGIWECRGLWVAEDWSKDRLRDRIPQHLDISSFEAWCRSLTQGGYLLSTDAQLSDVAAQDLLRDCQATAVLALAVPGEMDVPGFVAVFRSVPEPWGQQEAVALQTAATALSTTLARERLFAQVQATLNETEALYRGSAALSEADTYDEVLQVLLEHTVLGAGSRTASIYLFDRAWAADGQPPAYAEIVANSSEGQHAGAEAGAAEEMRLRFRIERFPEALAAMQDGAPIFVEDLSGESLPDRRLRALLERAVSARGVVIVPLVVGGLRTGFLHADYPRPHRFTEVDQRRLTTLAQQAAIAVLNIRQLQETEARARRERLIRQISARIQESPDVEGVLQTAVQELGRAFGTSRSRIQFRPRVDVASSAMNGNGVKTGTADPNDEASRGQHSD